MSDDMDDEDEETYSAIRTVLGSTRRTARWHLTDEVDVLTALGRSSFDLRLVETTGRPVVEVSVTCILGSVSLVVPPGTLVVLDGTSFLARAVSEVEAGDVSGLPRIEVTATTVLGRVRVVSRELEAAAVETIETAPVDDAPVDATSAPAESVAAEDSPAPDEAAAVEPSAVEPAGDEPDAAAMAS